MLGRAETPMGGGEQPRQPCVVSRVTQTGGLWAELWEVWFHQQVHLFHYLEGESLKVMEKQSAVAKRHTWRQEHPRYRSHISRVTQFPNLSAHTRHSPDLKGCP